MKPSYVRDYRRLVGKLIASHGHTEAMELAVGGSYEAMGKHLSDLLYFHGLKEGHYLIDVGCGSGRVATALRAAHLRYLGTDVVPELIEYARAKANRPDWRFTVVEGLTVPEEDESADMVAMFSVLTHLSTREGRLYVRDALRVLKPGGALVVSFLDSTLDSGRSLAGGWMSQMLERIRGRAVKNTLLSPDKVTEWGREFGVSVEFYGAATGQSRAVFRKDASARQISAH